MNPIIDETFHPRPSSRWHRTAVGGGRFILSNQGLRLLLTAGHHNHYADAQIDDYGGLPRRHFPWQPPLHLTVRARISGPLRGTAGFGFWNNPFSPLGGSPALPAAIWFFYASPPSNLPLALDIPGYGWKAACIDATRPSALACLPLALLIVLLNQVPTLYRWIWPLVQRPLGIAEAALPTPGTQWATYIIDWHEDYARFMVDGVVVLECDRPPRGPLGFVAWVDNQWMVATPSGRFGWGLLDTGTQWIDLDMVQIRA